MSNEFEFDAPEEIGGSAMVEVGGKYHFAIEGIEVNPKLGDNVARGFRVSVRVLAGPESEIDKTAKLLFRNGDASHKDKGKFARDKQGAFFIASNLMLPEQRGKTIKMDLDSALHHQFLGEIEMNPSQNDPTKFYPEIRHLNAFHIDDPRAKLYPKNEACLEQVSEFRRDAKFFEDLVKPKSNVTPKSVPIDDAELAGL